MNTIENNSPVYLQIAEKLATQIFGGKLGPGAQLSSVREIALSERVNPNTVQKALGELERDGLILSRSTNGKFVTEDVELIMRRREEYAERLTKSYEKKMKDVGAEITMPKIMWLTDEQLDVLTKPEKNKERRKWFF
ncbi:GntR family transcriptional regulator [Candidatus Saccharibacteria bacterium]|nr:GntR family transcriptional regulator [Candidatus Saccharibacteria bacterium]